MKKFLTTLLVLLAATCGLLGFAACDQEPDTPADSDPPTITDTPTVPDPPTEEHVHDWGEWISDGEGNHIRTCKLDKTHTETEACEEHLESAVTDPTCEADGYTTHTCSVCEYSYTDAKTDKLGHDYEYTFNEATHTHTAVCKHDETHKLEAAACTFDDGVQTLAPTCEADGAKKFTCEVCQGSYEGKIDKLGHDWRYTFHEEDHTHTAVCHNDPSHKLEATQCDMTNGLETKPTCTTDGYTTYICKTCLGTFTTYDETTQHQTGHSYPETWEQGEGDKHYHICTNPNCGEKEEATCSFTQEVVTEPTCEAQGFTTKTCPGCGASKVDESSYVGPLDHDFENAEYRSDNKGKHYRQCTRKDCTEVEESECTEFSQRTTEATCDEDGLLIKTCTKCDYTIETINENRTGHNYGEYTVDEGALTHTGHCLNGDCDATDTQPCVYTPQNITPATCTNVGSETQVCPICQNEKTIEIPALGHNFEGATYLPSEGETHYRMCTRNCGEEGDKQEGRCVMAEGSSLKNSCTSAGSTASKRCAYCGRTEDGEVIPANGHTWKNPQNEGWTPTADGKHKRECTVCGRVEEKVCEYTERETLASCTTDGERVKTCSVCQDVVTVTLPRLGHDIKEYTFESGTDDLGISYHYHTGYCIRCRDSVREACQLQLTGSTSATCTDNGTETYHCIRCNHTHTYVTQDAKGHTVSGGYKFDAENHKHYGTCMSCGAEIDPTECTPDLTKQKVQSQTCLMGGYTENTCSVCGNKWKENVTESFGGHDWVVSPNSYLKQYNQHSVHCSRCPASKPVACTYTEETVQVSCTADGYTRKYCTECQGEQFKEVFRSNGHAYQYEYKGDGNEHNTHHITCANCDLDETADCKLRPLTTVATCTQPGENDLICEVCSKILEREDSEALGHVFEYEFLYANTHRVTCTRCRYSYTATCKNDTTLEEGNCVTPTKRITTCRECENSVTTTVANPLGHQWDKWTVRSDTDEHVRSCLNCQAQETRGGHDYSKSNVCDCGEDGLLYEEVGSDLRVKRNLALANAERIVIPMVHDGKTVVEIGDQAFRGFDKLKEIVIPTTVKTIGDYGLNYCSKLEKIIIGNVKENGDIDTETPSQLTSIGDYALQGNGELVTFVLPASLTTIGSYAFLNCSKYDDFTVPDGAEEIGKGAFNNTKHVNDAKLESDGLYLGKHLIRVRENHSGTFEIKKGTLSVAEGAFENCTGLTELTIYAGILRFDKDAFKGCTGLTSVKFEKADDGQTSDELLKAWFRITFENDDASPLNYTDSFNIVGLDGNVKIPENNEKEHYSVTYIPVGTFRGDKIKSIVIPNSVTHIGAAAFFGCTELESVTLPKTALYIGAYAFYGCTSLKTITFTDGTALANRKESYFVGENAFAGTKYYKTATNWDEHGILYIGNHLIKANSGKEAAVDTIATIPDLAEMTRIPEGVAVTKDEIVINNDTRTISTRAFENCTGLTQITIGEKVEFIGQQAFSGCSGLSKAIVLGTTNFLAWSFYPGTTDRYIGRSVNPNPNGNDASQANMAHYLTAGYPGEWSRLVTA